MIPSRSAEREVTGERETKRVRRTIPGCERLERQKDALSAKPISLKAFAENGGVFSLADKSKTPEPAEMYIDAGECVAMDEDENEDEWLGRMKALAEADEGTLASDQSAHLHAGHEDELEPGLMEAFAETDEGTSASDQAADLHAGDEDGLELGLKEAFAEMDEDLFGKNGDAEIMPPCEEAAAPVTVSAPVSSASQSIDLTGEDDTDFAPETKQERRARLKREHEARKAAKDAEGLRFSMLSADDKQRRVESKRVAAGEVAVLPAGTRNTRYQTATDRREKATKSQAARRQAARRQEMCS